MGELSIAISIKQNLLSDLGITCDAYLFFLKALNACDPRISAFYAQGDSIEDALKNKIFQVDNYVIPEVNNFIGGNLPHATGLWDGNLDESMSIMFSTKGEGTTINIGLERYVNIYNINNLRSMLLKITEKYVLNYFSVTYSNVEKVFPERPAAGWMIYLPIINNSISIKNAECVENISTKINKGTLFITKVEYDHLSKLDNHSSNDLEIELVDAGVLPLYKDI